MHSAKPDSFEFGGFRLDRRRRLLYDTTGRPAHLTAKAFDLLVYFLEHPGEVIERETLIEALWPKTIVEDNNLNQVIAALRRVLGDGFIVTVTGRGYQFVVDPQPFTSATVTAPASSAEATERGAAPDAAEPKTPSAVPVEAPARSRWRALTAAAGVLALAIAAIAYLNRGPADAVATDPSAIGAFGSPAPSSARAVPTHAIAVLPFISLSDDSQQDYFADGLTEELINRLARFGRLQVTARTSSFTFKGSDKSVGEIARALEVRYVLEGSVAKAEQRLRIRVQLVEAANGYSLWSESFDRELRDVLNIQEEIAASVAESLLGPLGVPTKVPVPVTANVVSVPSVRVSGRARPKSSTLMPSFVRKMFDGFKSL